MQFTEEQFEQTIQIIGNISSLKSLYIHLSVEDQVDSVMNAIPGLEYLNGLPLEREILGHTTDENSDVASDNEFEDVDAGGVVSASDQMNLQEPSTQTNMDIFNSGQLSHQ